MRYYLYTVMCCCLIACSKKDKINTASTKLKVLDLYAENIYDLNKSIQTQSDSANVALFTSFDDSLKQIRDELIAASGGYTRLGEYANLPAEKEVEEYFYGSTDNGATRCESFFEGVRRFDARLKMIWPESRFSEKLDKRFGILMKAYGLKSKQMIFKDLNISEAVAIIESIRCHVAIEQTEYLLMK